MPWFRIDDGLHSHPKAFAAGNAAIGLWTRLGSYCAQHLTDGRVPGELVKSYGRPAEIAALVRVHMIAADGDAYVIPDYLEYNPSAAQVRADRDAATERQRRWRESHGANANGDAVTSRRDNAVSSAAPSHTHPIPNLRTSSVSPSSDSAVPHGRGTK